MGQDLTYAVLPLGQICQSVCARNLYDDGARFIYGSKIYDNHTFSAFWLRSSVVSVLISLISDRRAMPVQLIN